MGPTKRCRLGTQIEIPVPSARAVDKKSKKEDIILIDDSSEEKKSRWLVDPRLKANGLSPRLESHWLNQA